MKLFVDDERPCPDGWTLARTYEDAIEHLVCFNVAELSLDHDLGSEKTGYDVAAFVEEMAADGLGVPALISVHSANPVGRARIEQCIASIKRFQERTPQ